MGIFSRLFGKKDAKTTAEIKPSATPAPLAPMPPAPTPVAPKKPESEGVTFKVTGVAHYEKNVRALGDKNDDYRLSKRAMVEIGLEETRVWEYDFCPIKVELVPEPDNPHDPKAVKVVVDGLHVGYIKAGSCSRVLRMLAEDRIQKIDVKVGGGRYKYLAVDYNEDGTEEYDLEQHELPFYVHLSIIEKKPEA